MFPPNILNHNFQGLYFMSFFKQAINMYFTSSSGFFFFLFIERDFYEFTR